MQDHRKLAVWRKAQTLSVRIHDLVRSFPQRSPSSLRAQLQRAAMSVPSIIVEGAGRDSRVDFARFLTMAIASSSEVEHHLESCRDFGLIEEPIHERLGRETIEVRRMLFGLRRAVLA